jgi:hypothetical protein
MRNWEVIDYQIYALSEAGRVTAEIQAEIVKKSTSVQSSIPITWIILIINAVVVGFVYSISKGKNKNKRNE